MGSAPYLNSGYFRQAAKLRWCLHQNSEDGLHARKGGRFVYLVDTNIVLFFLNPERDQALIRTFGTGHSFDVDAGTALVTAEYVFSRELVGQHASPVLIAPSHADDLQDVITAMAENPLPTPEDVSVASQSPGLLRKLVQAVQDRKVARSEAIRQLREIVPQLAFHFLEGGFQEAAQLLRLYNSDLMRPLSLHPAATRDVLNMDAHGYRDAIEWKDRLLKERHVVAQRAFNEQGARVRVVTDDDKKARRDGEVIVQTLRLNENANAAGNGVRYVLVTADQTLISAYTRWFWQLPPSERAARGFVLRDLLQYVPILNVQDMPDDIVQSDIMERARKALDSLIFNDLRLEAEYPAKLLYHLLPPLDLPPAADTGKANAESAEEITRYQTRPEAALNARQIWRAAFRDGVILNAELIQRRLHAEFDHLARLLREDRDLVAALHEEQRHLITDVFTAHASITTQTNLRYLVDSNVPSPVESRRRLILLQPFTTVLNGELLEDALDRLTGHNEDFARKVEQSLTLADKLERVFFAACVAHRCSRWGTARLNANWVLNSLPADNEDDRQDLIYLQASIARLEFGSRDALLEAFADLSEAKESHKGQHAAFYRARALCEQSALLLSALFRTRLRVGNSPREASAALLEHSAQLGDLVLATLETLELMGGIRRLFEELHFQAKTNALKAFVFARFFAVSDKNLQEWSHKTRTQTAMKQVCNGLSDARLTLVQSFEYALALHTLGMIDRNAFQARTRAIAENTSIADRNQSAMDVAEYTYLCSTVSPQECRLA